MSKTPSTTIINNTSMVKEPLETEETIDMNELTVVPMSVEEADGVIECVISIHN